MTGDNHDTVFKVGRYRGKGNAEELLGDSRAALVSDDYGAYTNLTKNHGLCWAHILRKLRDLRDSTVLKSKTKKHCIDTYQEFSNIYQSVSQIKQTNQSNSYLPKAKHKLINFSQLNPKDPIKLIRIKKTISKKIDKYLTCLKIPNLPMDNNKAERALRHIVLKRKNPFGSQNLKSAETLEILLSVLLSLKWSDPDNFFVRYGELRG